MLAIFDCDGVLVDSSHRYRNLANGSIDLEYWRANSTAEKIAQDRLLPHADMYRQMLSCPHTLVAIATARECKQPDFDFVRERLGWPNFFVYRKPDDTRRDYALKIAGLNRLLNLRQTYNRPAHMFEDNPVNIARITEALPHIVAHYVPSNQGN